MPLWDRRLYGEESVQCLTIPGRSSFPSTFPLLASSFLRAIDKEQIETDKKETNKAVNDVFIEQLSYSCRSRVESFVAWSPCLFGALNISGPVSLL